MSGPRDAGPSPDGRHDDLPPEDLAGLTLHAPDDPRDLDVDRAAWLTEEETGVSRPRPTPGPSAAKPGAADCR